jgi:tricorn protease
MERSPSWSPDGKTIAYFSDETGEYALHLAPQNGQGQVVKIAMPEPCFYRQPVWSPDSKKIAFADARMRIWYVDVESKKATQVDKERFWDPASTDWIPVWSPDSKMARVF